MSMLSGVQRNVRRLLRRIFGLPSPLAYQSVYLWDRLCVRLCIRRCVFDNPHGFIVLFQGVDKPIQNTVGCLDTFLEETGTVGHCSESQGHIFSPSRFSLSCSVLLCAVVGCSVEKRDFRPHPSYRMADRIERGGGCAFKFGSGKLPMVAFADRRYG